MKKNTRDMQKATSNTARDMRLHALARALIRQALDGKELNPKEQKLVLVAHARGLLETL